MSGVEWIAAIDKSNKEACLQEIYVIDRIMWSDVWEAEQLDQPTETSGVPYSSLHFPFIRVNRKGRRTLAALLIVPPNTFSDASAISP